MSDTDQETVPLRNSKRRFRRLIGAVGLFGMLALIAALTMWAARPRWYTYVSKPTNEPPTFSLVFRVPVGWECNDIYGPSSLVGVRIQRRPAVGFAAWWNRALHLDAAQRLEDLSIYGYTRFPTEESFFPELSGKPDDCIRELKRYEQQLWSQSGDQLSLCVFEHTLGPALDETKTFRPSNAANAGPFALPFVSCVKETYIVPRPQTKHVCDLIMVSSNLAMPPSDRYVSTWDEIVRSIRVVQK